jgi:hypothetical protein
MISAIDGVNRARGRETERKKCQLGGVGWFDEKEVQIRIEKQA